MRILVCVAFAGIAAVALSGCAVVDVASTAVDVTATAVGAAADVGGAVVSTAADTVSGSSGKDKKSN